MHVGVSSRDRRIEVALTEHTSVASARSAPNKHLRRRLSAQTDGPTPTALQLRLLQAVQAMDAASWSAALGVRTAEPATVVGRV